MTLEEAAQQLTDLQAKIGNTKEPQIIEFINRRFPNDQNWLTGNCYWMAHILAVRFNLDIYYDPIIGHFFVGEGEYGPFYDWTGRIKTPAHYLKLSNLKEMDPTWYDRLMRDCKC